MKSLLMSLVVLLPYVMGMVAEGQQNCLDIYPKAQDILKYSAVELNCTIAATCGQYSPSDLYYTEYHKMTHKEINSSWTVEIDNNTLGLRLPNTSLLHYGQDDKQISCRLRREGNVSIDVRAKADTRICDRPVALEQLGRQCKVVNMSMTCAWGNTPADNCLKAKLTLSKRGSPEVRLKDITIRENGQLKTGCEWEHLPGHGVYDLHVFCWSIDVYQFTINTTQIERPLTVEEIHYTRIGARSVDISWPPRGVREQLYHLAVSAQGTLIKNLNTTWTNVSFEHLRPYTEYVITIRSRYVTNGQWSDVKSDKFTTLSDVPEKQPEVSAGGWFRTGGDTRCSTVGIIFKDIQDRERIHPDSFKYVTRVESHSKEEGSCFNCSNATASHTKNKTVVVPTNCDVRVAVLSENHNGTATGVPGTIWIPQNGIPWPADVTNVTFIASNDSLVQVGWSSPSTSPTTGYTVYWHYNSRLPELSDFLTVGPEEDCALITLPDDYKKFSFGMSRQIGNSSTGVKWMMDGQGGCIYDQRFGPARPEDLGGTTVENGQQIDWRRPPCALHTGYPYGYQLTLYRQHTATSRGSLVRTSFVAASADVKTKSTLEGLEDGVQYRVQLQSIAVRGRSVNAIWSFTYSAPDNRNNLHYLLIVLCVPVILVGSACFLWRCKILVDKWSKGVKIKMCELPDWNNVTKPVSEDNDYSIIGRYYFKDPTEDGTPTKRCYSRGQTPVPRQKTLKQPNYDSPYVTSTDSTAAALLGVMAASDDSVKERYLRMDGGKVDTVDDSCIGKNGLVVSRVSTPYRGDKDTYTCMDRPPPDHRNTDCSVSCVHVRPPEFPPCEDEGIHGYVRSTVTPQAGTLPHYPKPFQPHYPKPDVQYRTDL